MYNTTIAYVLWICSGFGALGFQRFYLGKFGSGLLFLMTGGLFGLGSLYDLITLPMQVREANLRLGYREALDMHIHNHMASGGQRPMREVNPRMQGQSYQNRRESLEKVILKTAKANRGIVTPTEVALNGDTTLDEAQKALEKLAEKGYADIRFRKSGSMVFFFKELSPDGETPADLEDF